MTDHESMTQTVAVAAPRREAPAMTALRFVALLYVLLLVLIGVGVLGGGLFAGWKPFLVTSGSMAPAMNPGDLVITEAAGPGEAFNPPTIITFRDPGRGLVTHRVVKAERVQGGEVRYTTKGDANRVAESGTVGQADLVGSVRFVLRHAGKPVWWAQQGLWGPFGAWALASLAAVSLAAGLLRPRSESEVAP
jgi:signal peptidase I